MSDIGHLVPIAVVCVVLATMIGMFLGMNISERRLGRRINELVRQRDHARQVLRRLQDLNARAEQSGLRLVPKRDEVRS